MQCDHARHVELLLANQADAAAIDRLGRTALHYCVSANALECLRVLLESEPGLLNLADQQGRTALHLSCAEGTPDAARFLLAVPGIDVNATDHRLTTPLHWAAVCNRPEACTCCRRHARPCQADVPDAAAERGAADGARLPGHDAAALRHAKGTGTTFSTLTMTATQGFHECATVLQRYGGASASSLLTESRMFGCSLLLLWPNPCRPSAAVDASFGAGPRTSGLPSSRAMLGATRAGAK